MSALRSSAGPAVWMNGTSSSVATICASDVLPRPGGPASSTWSSALAARLGRLERDGELVLDRVLADELVERRGRSERRRPPRGARAGPACGRPGRADHRRAPFSAWAIRSSGVSPGAPSSSLSASCGREAEAEQAVAGEHPRVVPARDHDRRRRGARRADLLAQLDDDPLGRPLADPRRRLQARGVAGGDGAEHLARRAAGEDGERHLRPDGLHADQQQEQVALLLGGEAVEQQRVVAHDQVRVQRDVCPHARDVAQRLGRDGERGSRRRRRSTTTWSARRDRDRAPRRARSCRPAPPRAARRWCGRSRPRARRRRGRAAAARRATAASGPSAAPGPWPRGRCRRPRP